MRDTLSQATAKVRLAYMGGDRREYGPGARRTHKRQASKGRRRTGRMLCLAWEYQDAEREGK